MYSEDDKVSIVIPVYNSEKFLEKSIESVTNQTWKNIEIIVIDDGSNDKSLEILKKYSDDVTIFSQSNQGLASALNKGIKQSNGRWFKWFSPDDVLEPNAIEILVKTAKELPPNTIVYSNWKIINEDGKKLRDFYETNYNTLESFEFNLRLLDGQQINVNTTLMPSILFKKGCIFNQLEDPVSIDYDFFLRAGILYNTGFHLVPKLLVNYRINSNQLSHKNISQTLSYLSVVRKRILSELNTTEKERYDNALKNFKKNKTIKKKTMDFGLKLITRALPSSATDRILVFYLNKIRRTR